MKISAIRRELAAQSDDRYRAFSAKLTPTRLPILGVRVPTLRRIARGILRDEPDAFLAENGTSFEEVMIQALVLGKFNVDRREKERRVRRFLAKIDNWAVCDIFCGELKSVRAEPEFWREKLLPLYTDRREFYARFAAVMSLSHFLTERFIDEELARLDSIRQPDYYAKMGTAWAFSAAYVKFPRKTEAFLRNAPLNDETFRKTLQKIIESNRVAESDKEKIRAMKNSIR